MKLFEIDENFQIRPNKVWIAMIPEFKALLDRDKGGKGDSEGRKKLKSRREFIYIYMVCDFGSPLREFELNERIKESLLYAELTMKDIDNDVIVATKKYEKMQLDASRSLRTYKSMMQGLESLDRHFESINFTDTDEDGKLLHSPDKFAANITRMNKVYDELDKFKKRVEDDLKNMDTGIRGQATLGDNEAKKTNANTSWSEGDIMRKSAERAGQEDGSVKESVSYESITSLLEEAEDVKVSEEELANMEVLGEDKKKDGPKYIEV